MNEHIDAIILTDYLHRELAPERDAGVHAHLAQCGDCKRLYDAETRLNDLIREEALASEREVPPGLIARIRGEIETQAAPSWWQQLLRAARPAVALPVAAVLVLAVALSFSTLEPRATAAPSIAASYYLDDHAALSTSSLPFSQTAAVPAGLSAAGSKSARQTAVLTVHTIASE